MEEQTEKHDSLPVPKVPPPTVRLPVPAGGISPELKNAWIDAMISGIKHTDQMFDNILRKFTVPFWLSVGMNVAVFILGTIGFTVAMILSALTGHSYFSLVFGALDTATVLAFFFSTPIKRLERDVAFITWIGLVYNSYWTGLTYTYDLKTFQADLEKIMNNAQTSIKELLDKQKELA